MRENKGALISDKPVSPSVTPEPLQGSAKRPWTPGPWRAILIEEDGLLGTFVGDEEDFLTACVQHDIDDDGREKRSEHLANARLIAAAPELFEALERLLRYVYTTEDYKTGRIAASLIRDASAVLDKADGSNPAAVQSPANQQESTTGAQGDTKSCE